jgi:hypothetical protein
MGTPLLLIVGYMMIAKPTDELESRSGVDERNTCSTDDFSEGSSTNQISGLVNLPQEVLEHIFILLSLTERLTLLRVRPIVSSMDLRADMR